MQKEAEEGCASEIMDTGKPGAACARLQQLEQLTYELIGSGEVRWGGAASQLRAGTRDMLRWASPVSRNQRWPQAAMLRLPSPQRRGSAVAYRCVSPAVRCATRGATHFHPTHQPTHPACSGARSAPWSARWPRCTRRSSGPGRGRSTSSSTAGTRRPWPGWRVSGRCPRRAGGAVAAGPQGGQPRACRAAAMASPAMALAGPGL